METLRLLYVCTGNTCRSPMAAALTEELGNRLSLPFRLETRSRGLYAVEGDPMSSHAREALAERGVTAEHRAAMLEEEDLEWADLVLTMTLQHKRFLWEAFPAYQDKTFTLKEYVRELETIAQKQAVPQGSQEPPSQEEPPSDAAKAASPDDSEGGSPEPGQEADRPDDFSWEYLANVFSALDVRDPFGGDLEDYRRTRDELEDSIRRMLELLAATVDGRENRL